MSNRIIVLFGGMSRPELIQRAGDDVALGNFGLLIALAIQTFRTYGFGPGVVFPRLEEVAVKSLGHVYEEIFSSNCGFVWHYSTFHCIAPRDELW